MSVSVLKRFLIALVAIAFIGANLPVNCIGAAAMQGSDTMAAHMGDPGAAGTDNAPAPELGKMLCGALACAGIAGLPARYIIGTPDLGKRVYPPNIADRMAGISIKPDPFPPRPTAHA